MVLSLQTGWGSLPALSDSDRGAARLEEPPITSCRHYLILALWKLLQVKSSRCQEFSAEYQHSNNHVLSIPAVNSADLLLVAKGNSSWLMVSRNFPPAGWGRGYRLARALQTGRGYRRKRGKLEDHKGTRSRSDFCLWVPCNHSSSSKGSLWEFVSDTSCPLYKIKAKQKVCKTPSDSSTLNSQLTFSY